MNFENFGHTTKNTILRLVKLLADLSTRLKLREYNHVMNPGIDNNISTLTQK